MNVSAEHPAGTSRIPKSFWFIALLLATFGTPAAAMADATYTYTGNSLTSCSGSYAVSGTSTCNGSYMISGSFTLAAALSPDLTDYSVSGGIDCCGVTSFSYSDNGQVVINNSTKDSEFNAQIWTNDLGQIVQWDILVSDDLNGTGACSGHGCDIETVSDAPGFFCFPAICTEDVSGIFDPAGASNSNNPGTWTMTSTSPIPTPEPGSFALMLCGIGLLVVMPRLIRLNVSSLSKSLGNRS
jgi:hypothetical protein